MLLGFWLSWLSLIAPAPTTAADLPRQISQYAHTAWTARDGAQLGLVFAMAQTPDGYLWIAGSFGLFRFDGLSFKRWQPPAARGLPSGPYSLLVSRDGTLWIGTYSGLSSWDGKTFVRRHEEIGMGFVTSLLEDRDGTVWAGVYGEPGRLCAVRAGQVRCHQPEGGFGQRVWSLAEDQHGQLWVGSGTNVWQWTPGAPHPLPMQGRSVGDMVVDHDGQLVVGLIGHGLLRMTDQGFEPLRFRLAADPGRWLADTEIRSNKLLLDRDGGLWIGSDSRGLIHVRNGLADTFTRAEGLSGDVACGLFEDREGNIWYGSERGLDRFSKLPVTTLTSKQGLPNAVARSVLATRDGSVWMGTVEGLARWKGGHFTVFRQSDGLPDVRVQSLHEDGQGRLWVATDRGVAFFDQRRFTRVDSGPSHEINAMSDDALGQLWLAGDQGLARLRQGRLVENIPWERINGGHKAETILADDGGVWMASWAGDGVSYVRDGQTKVVYTSKDGLGSGVVSHLRLDADGALWAATGSGLSRIRNGRVATLSTANGLPCGTLHWSVQDQRGAVWVSMSCGLARIDAADLQAWMAHPTHRVQVRTWGAADGIPLLVTPVGYYKPSVTLGPDGKIWQVGASDVQLIDPDDMPSNTVAPPVHIDALVADKRDYPLSSPLRLPPLVRDIAIEFSALTLVDPKRTAFRWKLEGHDDDWHEAMDRRLASYGNLPPGDYRFRVTAANNSGVWNEDGAQLAFSIEPAIYQSRWFRGLAALMLAALVWAGFQLRLRLRIRRLQRQFESTLDARVSERTRIARDLHDTLLQRFHGLLLQFQAAANLLPERPSDAKRVLSRAIDQVADAITEGRDAVHALRASVVETNNLAEALQSFADGLAEELGLPPLVELALHGAPRTLHPIVRDEAFRIACEALRNAFRHAQASSISLELSYDTTQLRLEVRDNGKGMPVDEPVEAERTGHFGLSGMRERAALVGGSLSIDSSPDRGTLVALTVPGSRAYIGASLQPTTPLQAAHQHTKASE